MSSKKSISLRSWPLVLGSLLSLNLGLVRESHAAPVTLERLEASVNASIILLSDVRQFRKTVKLREQLDPLFAGTTVAAQGANAAHGDIVEFLINEKLIAQQFPVSDAEVEQEINSIQANNRIDRDTLRRALQQQGFAFSDYFELIRSSAAKRNLIDRDIRTKVTISDEDVRNYYYNNLAGNKEPQRAYRVRILTVNPKNFKTPAAGRDIIERALKEIRGGESFEEVAKRFSDDATASSGGDLGTLTEDQMSPQIHQELKKLQVGEVSGVLTATDGRYFLLQLVKISAPESSHFDKMKDEIRNQLAAAEYQHQVSLWIERQRQSAFIHRAPQAQ